MTDTQAGKDDVVHGYIREHLFMTASEHADLVALMVAAAERGGFTLGKVFTEKVETVPQAFSSLVQAVVDDKAVGIVVPNLLHLSIVGPPATIRDELQETVGTPVIVAAAGGAP